MPTKEEFSDLHKKVDVIAEDVSFIKGKLEGGRESNGDWLARVGVIGAILALVIDFVTGG